MRKELCKPALVSVVVAAALATQLAFPVLSIDGGYPVRPEKRSELSSLYKLDGLSAEDIIARMTAANQIRESLLQRYTATRDYHAVSLRLNKEAAMQVQVQFEKPRKKSFIILSEEGSDTIRKRVFRALISGEVEYMNPEVQRRSAFNLDNYRFKLVGKDFLDGRSCYLLDAVPLRKEKYLFYGRCWIDERDFALVKMRGCPAKMPSVWTRKIEFERDFQKIQDYWLPAKDEAESQLLAFGKSQVVVKHSNYQF